MARAPRRQNAGACPGSFLAQVAFVDEINAYPRSREEIGGSKPDNAATDDQYVRVFAHKAFIVKGAIRF